MTKKVKKEKLFVIKKYVYAVNAFEALKKERKHAPDDCWIDEGWRQKQEDVKDYQSAIGFFNYPYD